MTDLFTDKGARQREPLRITYVVHHYPPTFRAGSEQYTHRVARWMQAQGHDVQVITLESIDAGSTARIDATMDTFEGIPVQRLHFKLIGAPDELTWRYDNPLLERWMADYVAARTPDFVHFMAGYLIGIGPLRAVRSAGIPMALTLHDYWFVCPRHTLQRGDGSLCEQVPEEPIACARCVAQGQNSTALVDKFTGGLFSTIRERFGLAAERDAIAQRRIATSEAITWPDVVLAPAQFLANKIHETLPQAHVHFLPQGYDRTYPTAPRNVSDPRPQGGVQFAYMGQISPHKGVHVLVEAFRKLNPADATLHIHGGLETNATYSAMLRQMAGDARNIHFHGSYHNHDLPNILESIDGIVVPSIWYENSPLVIVEALAAGVPVITSRLGGMAELVDDNCTGLLFSMGDVDALAAALRTFAGDEALRSRLSANASNSRRRSVADEMTELEAIYRTVIASKTAPLPGAADETSTGMHNSMKEISHARGD